MKTSAANGRALLTSVLVPTDFSKSAELAIQRSLLLPLAVGATLHVIHVIPKGVPTPVRIAVERALEQSVERMREETRGGVKVTSAVHFGEVHVEIIRCARTRGSELVVLGRHGQRGFPKMLLGTTAERVIRKGDAPVLVVSLKPTHPYRTPLIATDLEDASHRTFELALRVLGPQVETIRVVHAYNVPFEGFVAPTSSSREKSDYRRSLKRAAVAGLEAFLASYEDAGVEWTTVIRSGDARVVVIEESVHARADLVAVGTHGRVGVAHALIGSVAESVIAAARCDVLVARPVRFSFELP